jgi:hypothetical protein
MTIWVVLAFFFMFLAATSIAAWLLWSKNKAINNEIPEHIWQDLKAAIPDADYHFLRTTSGYMGETPGDLISRLSYIGAIHETGDIKQIRLTILELKVADQEKLLKVLVKDIPSEIKIMWLSVISVSGVSSLVAFVFFMLQQVGAVR